MALTAHPFHPVTGELLPGYRDAYLRGDLSGKNNDLVDAYLQANPGKGTEAFQRFHALQHQGHAVRPVGWLQQQFHLIRTEPARFRHRAGALVLAGALLTGAVFAAGGPAATRLPGLGGSRELTGTPELTGSPEADLLAPEATLATTTVSGRILDEKGNPLVGATVLDKRSGRGVSTDASGTYTIAVPRSRGVALQFGYGGYQEETLLVSGHAPGTVSLLPRTDLPKKRRWWLF